PPWLAMPLFDAVDGALRHSKKPAELGLAPAERRPRHADGHSDEQTIALLMVASLPIGFPVARDLIRVRFGKGPSHRTLSKPDATFTDAVCTNKIPQAAEAAWGLQKCLIACFAVMDRSCTGRERSQPKCGSIRL